MLYNVSNKKKAKKCKFRNLATETYQTLQNKIKIFKKFIPSSNIPSPTSKAYKKETKKTLYNVSDKKSKKIHLIIKF